MCLIETMRRTAKSIAALAFFPLLAAAQVTWNLPSSPIVGTPYTLGWSGPTSGFSATLNVLPPGGSTWNSIGGAGGPQGSVKVITVNNYSFSTAGTWSFKILDGANTVSTNSRVVASPAHAPTQSWLTLPPTTFYQGDNIPCRAVGTDADGNLYSVFVDVSTNGGAWTPFAYDGVPSAPGNTGSMITTDNNVVIGVGPAGTTYQFRVISTDTGGLNSGYLYSQVFTVSPGIRASFSWVDGPFTSDGTLKAVGVTASPVGATYSQTGTWSATNPGTYTVSVHANGAYVSDTITHNWTINSPVGPTIHWDLSLYQPFPVPNASGYYQVVRAIAHDDSHGLTAVQVDYLNASGAWTPFAYDNGGNGTDQQSDANFFQAPSGAPKGQCFRAQAITSSGASSGYIYLLTKPNTKPFVNGQPPAPDPFTYADLPPESNAPSNGLQNYFFPNGGSYIINSTIFTNLLSSLNGHSGIGIWFKDGVHDFDTSVNRWIITAQSDAFTWNATHAGGDEGAKFERINVASGNQADETQGFYNPGSIGSISGCSNISFLAENRGKAILRWASYSSKGTFVPVANDLLNILDKTLYVPSLSPDGRVRPWPLPGPFMGTDATASAITFDGLEFCAAYPLTGISSSGRSTRADNGRHLEISGSGITVQYCTFTMGPGWTVHSGQGSVAAFQYNTFRDTGGDGLNIEGNNTVLQNNYFARTGDDAIAIHGTGNTVTANHVDQSGWRGIYESGMSGGSITNNVFNSSASRAMEMGQGTIASTNITVQGNTFASAYTSIAHNYQPVQSPTNQYTVDLNWTSGITFGDPSTLTLKNSLFDSTGQLIGVHLGSGTSGLSSTTVVNNDTWVGSWGTKVLQ